MVNFAIVEDDIETRKQLLSYFNDYQIQKKITLNVHSFADGVSFLEAYKNINFDTSLLDIDLPLNLNGIQIAKKIRETDSEMEIAFITNISQYALMGYEVNAFSYLLKPISYVSFVRLIDKALDKINKKSGKPIILYLKNGIVKLLSNNIISVSIDDHYLKIKTKETTYTYRDTLSHFESLLSSEGFIKANNSQLINLAYVQKVEKDYLILEDENVQISRLKRKALLDALTKYYGEQL